MKQLLWIMVALIAVSACAIKRPLIAPRDIPAYEQRIENKRKEREDFLREQQEREQERRDMEMRTQQPAQPTGI